MKPRKVLTGFMLLLLAIAIFLLGMLTQSRQWPPTASLARWQADLRAAGLLPPAEISIRSDAAAHELRPCPAAGPRTMTALIIGQSHAANTIGERFQARAGVFNVFAGKCYAARDPLLGTSDSLGNLWTLIGDELVASGAFDNVMLVTAAISGSRIAEWAPGGGLHDHLLKAVRSLGPDRFTHVFLMQGESDLEDGTPSDLYRTRLLAVIDTLRQTGVRASAFIATESGFCGQYGAAAPADNAIVRVQQDVVSAHRSIFAGPNIDRDLTAGSDRYDGCHLSGNGARKLSRLWREAIAAQTAKR